MSKLEEAKEILRALGLPAQQQNNRSAYTLLGLLGLEEDDPWDTCSNSSIGIHNIIIFIKEKYEFEYAENSRESIRRQTIHQFEQAGLIERNADNPARPTNSGNTVYSIIPEALKVFRSYGSKNWNYQLNEFLKHKEKLVEIYMSKREIHKVPVTIDGEKIAFSPGKHNLLQKLIIKDFGSRFARNAKLLYVGDTANKNLYKLEAELDSIGIPITRHDKLPDVVLYNQEKDWIYLCEAVTSHGPISPKRLIELEEMLKSSASGKIYITCFLDISTFKKFADEIAWETEVWIAEIPDHMLQRWV